MLYGYNEKLEGLRRQRVLLCLTEAHQMLQKALRGDTAGYVMIPVTIGYKTKLRRAKN
jgi:hypothetical protein